MLKPKVTLLTTKDNPWNPFTNFDEWYNYDMLKGYNTCGLIDRLAPTSEALSDELNEEILEEAYDKIIAIGAIGNDGNVSEYVKVTKDRED